MPPLRTLLSWSSGKDCAWALHRLRQDPGVEVVGLLTTLNQTHDRVAMHAVRRQLLQAQADAVGLPLWAIDLPWPCTNEDYERIMGSAMGRALEQGIQAIAFGDLFLPDVRRYREEKLAPLGIQPLFPLWDQPTDALAREMLAAGVRAHLTCVDPRKVPRELAGRAWDLDLLQALPEGVDPCGEYGEFHSFCWDGPAFRHPVAVRPGEIVEREGFVFADLLPA